VFPTTHPTFSLFQLGFQDVGLQVMIVLYVSVCVYIRDWRCDQNGLQRVFRSIQVQIQLPTSSIYLI
jgi:hypothetical protein